MLTRMLESLQTTWGRIRDLTTAGLTAQSAAEQTKSSWARRVGSLIELPDPFKGFFAANLEEGRAFPYTIVTPSYEGFIHRTTEKVICDFGREIDVLERSGSTCDVQRYPLEGISYVEVAAILLDARFKICGLNDCGIHASSALRFNAVTDYLFDPILRRIREASGECAGATSAGETDRFDSWADENYKFMNYAKRSLLGGETVLHSILQPEIRARRFSILGRTYYRMVSPAHVTILTDRELIMIRDEERPSGETRHGGIWDYIPLSKIVRLSVSEKAAGLPALAIELPAGARLEYIFQAAARPEVDRLLDRFRAATAG